MLMTKGANASLVRSVGGSALHGAARGGHAAVVKLPIKAGADLEVAMRFGGSTLHTASPGCCNRAPGSDESADRGRGKSQ